MSNPSLADLVPNYGTRSELTKTFVFAQPGSELIQHLIQICRETAPMHT